MAMKTMNLAKLPVWIIVAIHIFHFRAGATVKWFKFGCSNYTFHKSLQYWERSRKFCQETGLGDLVSIESEEEWIFLKNTTSKLTIADEYFIGLRKDDQSGQWRWLSNKSTSQTVLPWAIGEPNGDGKCAAMYKDYAKENGKYDDLDCTTASRRGFICEFPVDRFNQENGDKRWSCYTFENDTPMAWSQAQSSCQFNNKHLVVMETEGEWEFIKNEIKTRNSGEENEWHIGLYRNLTTRKWTWINGKMVTINKWQKDQPQDGDLFTLMARESSDGVKGSFSSIKGNIKRGWICEEKTYNCQGVCMLHNPVQTTTTSPMATPSTTSSATSHKDKRCSCYSFETDQLMSWPLAMASCKLIDKDLVVIETEREWKFLTTQIETRKTGKYNEWHIGLYKSLITGNWTWINGIALTMDNWQENMPNDNDSYALIAKESPLGSLRSITGNTSRGWICEELTDNCQGDCLPHNLVQTAATSPKTIASPTHDPTLDPEGEKRAHDKDNSALLVIILGSLVAVLSAALLILCVCILSWRKKQRKDMRNATGARDQLYNQDGSSLSPENVARELGFSQEADPCDMRRENQRRETDQSSRQECGYAMLTPRTMMVPGDTSYASLQKSEQGDCIDESSVAASPLLQHDDENHDQLPTYVNMRSANYENIKLDG